MSEKRKLNKELLVRFTEQMYGHIMEESRTSKLSASSIVRSIVSKEYGDKPFSFEKVTRKEPPKPPAPEHILEMVRLREAVAELCGALVHNSIRERKAGNEEIHQAIEEVIPLVRIQVRELDRLKKRLLG